MRLFNSHIAISRSALVLLLQYSRCSRRASSCVNFVDVTTSLDFRAARSIMLIILEQAG